MKTINKCESKLVTWDGDIKVVNSARVSFAKEVSEIDNGDIRLINFLARHKHWTPFSHVRETFRFPIVDTCTYLNLLHFFTIELSQTDQAGMVIDTVDGYLYVRHSLIGWANIIKRHLEVDTGPNKDEMIAVYNNLLGIAPHSTRALLGSLAADLDNVPVADLGYDIAVSLDHPEFVDVTMYEHVPIFVARQRFKHMVGHTYNEVSRRYVDDEPVFFVPDVWREKADDKKQGSMETAASYMGFAEVEDFKSFVNTSLELYNNMIENRVCAEQARMVLPQNMMTEYYVTANVSSWERMYKQRIEATAQKEIRDFALESKQLFDTHLKGN